MKKWLSLVVVCLILTLLPLTANAHSSTGTMLGSNNVETFGATVLGATPCVGEPNILVFYTTFNNGWNVDGEAWNMDASEVEDVFFGNREDSVRSYYQRSSYGKVNITGTVYEYTAQHDASYYTETGLIMDEILEYYQDIIDWEQYDTNGDTYLDGIILVAKTWPYFPVINLECQTYVNKIGDYNICKIGFTPNENIAGLYTLTAHMFGLPNTNGHHPGDVGYTTILDSQVGDLSGIAKYVLGWIDDPHILSETGTFEILLPSSSLEGEIVIIHPNGDEKNRSWLIVEYVGGEGGNEIFTGVRLWKTMMNLDENHNGYPNPLNPGMIFSPYTFIQGSQNMDHLHRTFQPGMEITPYSYPSTSYVAACQLVSHSNDLIGCHMIITDLGFSGISIRINEFVGKEASLTIEVDNNCSFPETEAELITDSATYLSDSRRVEIARIECDKEIEVIAGIELVNTADGTRYPVEYAQADDFRELYLYLSQENAIELDYSVEYELDLTNTVKTYFGGQLAFRGYNNQIDVSNLCRPLASGTVYETGVTNYNGEQNISCFSRDGRHITYFSYENGILKQKNLDTVSGEITERELEVNPDGKLTREPLYINHVWMMNGDTYAVLFGSSFSGNGVVEYISIYDLDGEFLDEYIPDKYLYIVGENNAPLLATPMEKTSDPGNPFELFVKDGKINLSELTEFPGKVDPIDSVFKLTDRYYAYIDYRYGKYYTDVEIYDVEKNLTVFKTRYQSTQIGMLYHDDCLYLVYLNHKLSSSKTDLVLQIFDRNFVLREEKILVKESELTMASNIQIGHSQSGLWISFDGLFDYETLTIPSTILLTLNGNKSVHQYYRHGSKWDARSGYVFKLDEDTFYLAENSLFDRILEKYIYNAYAIDESPSPHTYQERITPATCDEDGYSTFVCTTCGDSYTDKYTVAHGHEYVDRVCIHCGKEIPMMEGVIRLSGANRYATGFAVAEQLKQQLDVEKFENIVVASGLNFPDALGGSYLAFVKKAPILLIDDSSPLHYESVQDIALSYIINNITLDGTVYLLGGKSAISEQFEYVLSLNVHSCVRLSGSNRYATNEEILREAGVNTTDEVLIATGTNYADSLSASATGLPMLLVDKALSDSQKEFLEGTSRKFVIIGGTGAVSAEIADELAAIGEVTRIKGANRYGTSVEIAKRYFTNPSAAVLAYAEGFPDGLCGGPLALSLGAPLILTSNESFAIADEYVAGITSGAVTGGTGRISDDTVREIFDLPGNTPIVKP